MAGLEFDKVSYKNYSGSDIKITATVTSKN